MKAYSALTLGLFLGVVQSPKAADRVCVYQEIQYRGWERCYVPGNAIADLGVRSKDISSIRFYGRSSIIAYADRNFLGDSLQLNSDVPDLTMQTTASSQTWNDTIGSLKVGSNSRNSIPAPASPPVGKGQRRP